ncbi:MAG: hypothetical protein LWX51_13030 [Deltaproteobacteria bacterium]|jgi:hypothetical protein|nr:hypothetical protein [Deltaproteobacteria bacterium]
MTFRFNRITFEDQFQKLEKAGQWLSNIRVETENTRFDEILRLNKEIVEHHNNNLVEELIGKYGNLKLWRALTEASSFIEIHEAFKIQKSHVHPRAKLKKMLEGPYHSWDEDVHAGNIEPRNTLFELEAASKFKKGGAKITGFDDVDFVFKKTKFNVQCKRLHSEKKVRDNVSEAATQFYKRMRSRPNLKGIVCLSIDKLTGKEEMILKIKSPDEIRPKLTVISNSFLAKYRDLWHNLLNTNILAVLLFVHMVANIEEEPYDLLTTCRDIAFDVIPQQNFIQILDYNLIIELCQRIQGSV